MKITHVEARPLGVPVDPPLRWGSMEVSVHGGVVVRVHTDEGIVGIGEAGLSAAYFTAVNAVLEEQLVPLLVGADPLMVGQLWKTMFDATHKWGRRGIETYALSGVDIALWDILGKVAGQPVHRLLGTQRQEIRAYFAPSLKRRSDLIPELERAADEGFLAIKVRAGLGVVEDLSTVELAREILGDDVQVMVDANMRFDRHTALILARELEDLGVDWLEEPIRTDSLPQYAEEHLWLRDHVGIKLAGGESLFTRYEFIDVIPCRVFDILQPDCTTAGGISEVRRVADMASAHHIACIPHVACSSGTGIALAAGLHANLAVPEETLMEFDPYRGPGWQGLLAQPIEVVNGMVRAPAGPGLGVELAEGAWDRFDLRKLKGGL